MIFAVWLMAAINLAPAYYPPCTPVRTDSCTEAPPQTQWPTLYIPCPPDTYCPPHDIPHSGKQQRQ